MATVTTHVDDLDGSTEDVQTVRIRVGQQQVDIDLSAANRDKLTKLLATYFEKGREGASKGAGDGELSKAREWLKAHGHPVGDKGRISEDLMTIYRNNVAA